MNRIVHPLRTARRQAARKINPPEPGCVFCLEVEHPAGRNHDFALTFPDICQKHHRQLTDARRDADVPMEFERNRRRRIGLALKAISVFLHMLGDAVWRWGNFLLEEND